MFEAHEFTRALEIVCTVMTEGEKNHMPDQWRGYPSEYHAMKALRHLKQLRDGDRTEDHLSHAAARLLLALTLPETQ